MNFSVIIPTHNRVRILQEVLTAVQNQAFDRDEYEVIVVDDGSRDGSREYLTSLLWDKPRLFTFFQENKGPAVARNVGISNSSGRIVVFTDDDCLVAEDWLSRLKEGYHIFPSAAGVGGYLEAPREILEKNLIARLEFFETHFIYKADNKPYLGGFESPAGGTNNMSYLRDVLTEVGLFDIGFPVPAGEDADLKKRIVDRGYKIAYLPIKTIHLDPYSLRSFVRRSVTHGIGSAFFETKYQKPPEFKNVIKNFFLLPLTFFGFFRLSYDLPLSFLMAVKSFLMDYGRLIYLFERKRDRRLN